MLAVVIEELELGDVSLEKDMVRVFDITLEENWYAKWVTNKTLSNSLIDDAFTQIIDLHIANDN